MFTYHSRFRLSVQKGRSVSVGKVAPPVEERVNQPLNLPSPRRDEGKCF